MGIAHGFCQPIWWYQHDRYTDTEDRVVKEWLKPWLAFVKGDTVAWGTSSMKQYRRLIDNGIRIENDEHWDRYTTFGEVLMPKAKL